LNDTGNKNLLSEGRERLAMVSVETMAALEHVDWNGDNEKLVAALNKGAACGKSYIWKAVAIFKTNARLREENVRLREQANYNSALRQELRLALKNHGLDYEVKDVYEKVASVEILH
jgi:hypothetical protein